MPSRVCFGYSTAMLAHLRGMPHLPDTPERLTSCYNALKSNKVFQSCLLRFAVPPRHATEAELYLVHSEEVFGDFIRGKREEVAEWVDGKYLGDSLFCSPGTRDAALFAAGIAIDGALAVFQRKFESALLLLRPPGHHSGKFSPAGFCVFNNVALGIKTVQAAAKRDVRCAVVDIDVHHGNGTQQLFLDDSSVLYISMHRYDDGLFYPGGAQGQASVTGRDNTNINVPFNTQEEDWKECRTISDTACDIVCKRIILPALAHFQPEMIFVSCGFDAMFGDVIGCMSVVNGCEHIVNEVAKWQANQSNTLQRVGLVVALEGGYNLDNVTRGVEGVAHILVHGELQPCATSLVLPPEWEQFRKLSPNRNLHGLSDASLTETHVRYVNQTVDAVLKFHPHLRGKSHL